MFDFLMSRTRIRKFDILQFHTRLLVLITFCSLLIASEKVSPNLRAADGTVLLSIVGNIAESNVMGEKLVEFDRVMLEAFERIELNITTPWREGTNSYRGARLTHILDFVGARSGKLSLIALDGYTVDFDTENLDRYPIIVAYLSNGSEMRVKDLGPLWLLFPFDDHPELDTNKNRARSVWQLNRIEVH